MIPSPHPVAAAAATVLLITEQLYLAAEAEGVIVLCQRQSFFELIGLLQVLGVVHAPPDIAYAVRRIDLPEQVAAVETRQVGELGRCGRQIAQNFAPAIAELELIHGCGRKHASVPDTQGLLLAGGAARRVNSSHFAHDSSG